jgi:hypothetical protein
MDCFAEPVIRRRFAPTGWLAMTAEIVCVIIEGLTRSRKLTPDERRDIRVLAARWLARESTNSGRSADVRRIISHAAEPRVLSFQVSKYRPQPGTNRIF